MIKDQVKVNKNFENFKPCPFCKNVSHFVSHCPKINFIPDRDFLIKKLNYTEFQSRSEYLRRIRRSLNALKNRYKVNISALKCEGEDEEVIVDSGESIIKDEDSELKIMPQRRSKRNATIFQQPHTLKEFNILEEEVK